jgi:peptide/nickel transport system substrate-binding protein
MKTALGLGAGALALSSGFGVALAQTTDQMVVGMSQEPTNFHPLMPAIEVEQGVYWNLFSPLWGVDDSGNFTPDLAVEVPSIDNGGISKDGLNWTVKLRDNVKWHDGEPFTAEDVKYSLELLKNPEFKAGTRNGHELITSIEVVSPTEIKWTLKEPSASYLAVLSWTFLVPKHVLSKEADVNSPAFSAAPVGTGPYKWVSRTAGDQITLVASDSYHLAAPKIKNLIIKYIPDLTVMYTQFQTGAIDYISSQGITPDRYEEAKGLADRTLHLATLPNVETITLNLEHPPFKDLAVRQALYLGMDKKLIIDQIYYGVPAPAESYLPKEARAFNPNLPQHEFSPDKAKELLDQAGWSAGSDGIREKDGVRLSFILQAVSGNPLRAQLQQVLQQLWADIGAEVKLEQMPPAVLWADNWVYSKFQAIVAGTAFMVGPDADTTNYFSKSAIAAQGGAGLNNFQYKNDEVEKLLEEGKATLDEKARDEIYRRQQEIIRHDLPFLPIYYFNVIEGTKSKLVGYRANINTTSNLWNIRDWSWEA